MESEGKGNLSGKKIRKGKKVKLKIKIIFMMIIIMKYILKEKEKVI